MRALRLSALLLMIPLLSGCWTTEEGEKVGNIVKISREGAFVSTWEVTLIRGGMNDGSGAFGASSQYTVENDKLAFKLQQLMGEKKQVTIKFHKEAFWHPWRTDSLGYFLDDVAE
jgi:hypothetical protein